jgi:hypothetical protein
MWAEHRDVVVGWFQSKGEVVFAREKYLIFAREKYLLFAREKYVNLL